MLSMGAASDALDLEPTRPQLRRKHAQLVEAGAVEDEKRT